MIIIDIAREGTFVLYARVYADFAVLQDMLRIFNEFWKERISGLQPFGRQENLIGSGTSGRLKA